MVFGLTGPPADEVPREIRAAQVSSVFRQMPIALAVNAVNAALTAMVLEKLAGVILPFGWLCAVVLVTAGRLVLWLRYRRADVQRQCGLGFVAGVSVARDPGGSRRHFFLFLPP